MMKNGLSETSLYLHIPFCEKKCFYCSFVVSVGQKHHVDQYLDCLGQEAQDHEGAGINTIYIGGGTPTFLEESQIERLLMIIHQNFRFDKDIECTMEANPESIDFTKARLLKTLGVNRVSLGVQSFNGRYLRYLGRNHSAQKALQAFDILRKVGLDNINVDLMFCFPQQTLSELRRDIKQMVALGSEHISVYSLTIEGKSRFHTQSVQLDDNEIQARQYLLVIETLEKAGYHQYEVSNFSKKNKESIHNLNYWRCGNYIGLGVGAHSHVDGHRYWNVLKLTEYIQRIRHYLSPIAGEERLDAQQRLIEALLFGLRMNEGVDIKLLEKRFQCTFDDHRQELINEFVRDKFFVWEDTILKVTSRGRLLLDDLSARII